MTHVTCGLTAKNRDKLRNLTLGNRVWATCLNSHYSKFCLNDLTTQVGWSAGRSGGDNRVADRAAAAAGCRLPADAAQPRRPTRPHAVHEVHVPQHVVRRLPVPAHPRVDERRQLGRRRAPRAPAAARTAAHHARVAHRPLRHGYVALMRKSHMKSSAEISSLSRNGSKPLSQISDLRFSANPESFQVRSQVKSQIFHKNKK